MAFSQSEGACQYEVINEGEDTILKVGCESCSYTPSLEDSHICMARTVEKLMEVGAVTKIVFSQKRDYEYDLQQTSLLLEIAKLYNRLAREKDLLSYQSLTEPGCAKCATTRYNELHLIIFQQLRGDPIGAYVRLKRILRHETINLRKTLDPRCARCNQRYINVIHTILKLIGNTKIIGLAQPYLLGYKVGDRDIYRKIFTPSIKPDFMFTKLMASYPQDADEVDSYMVGGDTEVTIFKQNDSIQTLYHVMPPEFRLTEERYDLVDLARKIMAEHKPKKSEFVDPQRMRQVFFNVGKDLLDELATYRNIKLKEKETEQLAHILVRYTVGFGLVEVLLQDEQMQDISINSPLGRIPMFIVHGQFDDCVTNIYPTKSESESWASKLRMISGRPLDEANPILDTELELPGASTRVSVITEPLNPTGLAFSFRRHRDKPWTLPLFIKARMIDPLGAGIMSFCIDGTKTLLIAGTRSSGKSSFLSSLLIEIMRRYRIITIEDTLELPTTSLRRLGYNIQAMKVASALAKGSSEMSASDGIRSTLRLGDSALIVGEVRSEEAKALYEAMRIGAQANVVAGTIHGESPYGVYDRVVNDIGVPKTSFKATDLCVIANPIKSADGLHKMRRITQITEVRKHWNEDPVAEGGFVDLMKYDAKKDILLPTDDLINGDSEILKSIAANVSDFAGNWDAVWNNIMLRAKTKETIVNYANKLKDDSILESDFIVQCNDQFHIISEKVKEETGSLDSKRIFFDWEDWVKNSLKKRSMK